MWKFWDNTPRFGVWNDQSLTVKSTVSRIGLMIIIRISKVKYLAPILRLFARCFIQHTTFRNINLATFSSSIVTQRQWATKHLRKYSIFVQKISTCTVLELNCLVLVPHKHKIIKLPLLKCINTSSVTQYSRLYVRLSIFYSSSCIFFNLIIIVSIFSSSSSLPQFSSSSLLLTSCSSIKYSIKYFFTTELTL